MRMSRPDSLQDSEFLQCGIVKLKVGQPHLAEQVQIRRHDYSRAEMDGRWKRNLAGQVVCHEPQRHLTLTMWLLVNRSGNDPLVKIRRHFREQVGRDEFHFSRQAMCSQGAAHRQTVDRVHVEPSKIRSASQEIERLLKALLLVFVAFDDGENLSPSAMLRERFRKAVAFLAMI